MVKNFVFSALFAAISCSTPYRDRAAIGPDLAKTVMGSVAVLSTDPPSVQCAGVWVSRTLVLTAKHCIDRDRVFRVMARDLVPTNTQTIKISSKFDLALLQADPSISKHDIALLGTSAAEIGEAVAIVGHPLGLLWTFVGGTLSGYPFVSDGDAPTYWEQISVAIAPGNSGGGAFNSRGELIGICSKLLLNYPNTGLFVRLEDIKEFMLSTEDV